MIILSSENGKISYGRKEQTVDDISDIINLPKDDPMGSYAFVISSSEVYMLNGSREWVKI